jgi:Rps23 Pro-64 3,4-dihydroxylase Tpa1-like proline 4-hydroxylase
MEFIDIQSLNQRLDSIKLAYQSKKPFRYVLFNNFFLSEQAENIFQHYPSVHDDVWNNITYIDQKNKFWKNKFEENTLFDRVMKELNGPVFLEWLQKVTQVEDTIIGDAELFGGGLHQSINGAFLNVHVDYNFHPITKFHRRLNVLVYMNKDWQDAYEGHLELWDMTDNKKEIIAKYAPTFNHCVIFETNEVSYHGHPKKLNTPDGVSRKSIATYYYTKTRPDHELSSAHNTKYVNTEGVTGQFKRFKSGIKAFFERL